jgi:hypothetical protein
MMLEGQVAVISSGFLTPAEVVDVVDAMYDSPLYRRDVDSFVLYPARQRPPFLDRNRVPEGAVSGNPLLASLLAAGRNDIVVEDVAGHHHFNADLRNAGDLGDVLDRLEAAGSPLVAEHRVATLALYEEVFAHHEFTGRSSTMYAYEGIGSVYWHMVAKLLVAVQECALDASARHDDAASLVDRYARIRRGLGFNKTAEEYGAFPTDPYSHTPAHAGAQQPGMTGQVKEELLTRWAELGLTIQRGCISFDPLLVDAREFVSDDRSTPPALADIRTRRLDVGVGVGRAAYTICQVPVVLQQSRGSTSITVTFADRTQRRVNGAVLDRSISKQIFDRTGDVARLDVEI